MADVTSIFRKTPSRVRLTPRVSEVMSLVSAKPMDIQSQKEARAAIQAKELLARSILQGEGSAARQQFAIELLAEAEVLRGKWFCERKFVG